MIERCYRTSNSGYYNYGGRGIRICEFIRAGPENLFSIVGKRPKGLSIDRPDNDGNYSCGSCAECKSKGWKKNLRWATAYQQARNQRDLNYITINGVTKCLAEWAEFYGLHRSTVNARYIRGARGEDLFKPKKENLTYTSDGVTRPICEWAKIYGKDQSTLRDRWNIKGQGGYIRRKVCH